MELRFDIKKVIDVSSRRYLRERKSKFSRNYREKNIILDVEVDERSIEVDLVAYTSRCIVDYEPSREPV